jgi:hypothetical protein
MNRAIISVVLSLLCLAGVAAVLAQRRQLSSLHSEQQRIVGQLNAAAEASAQAPAAGREPEDSSSLVAASPELLRLRSEVNRLNDRLRSLAGVSNEHARLEAQLAQRQTNDGSGIALPPGYIRKSKARLAGYNTPEDTLETFLWALQNRDAVTLRQTLSAAMAQGMGLPAPGEPTEAFFSALTKVPGLAILNRRSQPDGAVEMEVTIAPGTPAAWFRLQLIDGQWKISKEF